ncbi:hypothetical protein pneo_cds_180 [Pandoravirus neocaledonia]|uniref:F-box incomplete domain containing protein n=1 Tax=Pandoravirus neocaledonia TaxID=2107708 RepID=A0A2U7UBG4_9VIRU|nr:hypothetical protein pneo_cds_180 [Pandoravirus neocaledonia]AVK75787.1 hypothetical protein pneo_cds_180 [Pandoravirus neocaledonia]
MKSAEKESRDILPDELWSLVLVGRVDADEYSGHGGGVEPRWRFAVRLVCRTWCAILDEAKPSLWGAPRVPTVCMWFPHRMVAWGRGRVVCASALAAWATSRSTIIDWNDGEHIERFCRWIAQCARDEKKPLDSDMTIVLAATGIPILVRIALERAASPDASSCRVSLPLAAGNLGTAGNETTGGPYADPRLGVHQTVLAWSHANIVARQQHHLTSLVATAAVKSGSRDAIDVVMRLAPWAMTASTVVQAAASNGDVRTIDAVFALADPSLSHVLDCTKGSSDPRAVAYCMDAAQAADNNVRSWAARLRDWLSHSENRAWLIEDAIASDNRRALALYDMRLSHWATQPDVDADAPTQSVIDTDEAIRLICRHRSIDCAHWLWERAQRAGRDDEMRVLAALTEGACRLSADYDDMPCSDDSDALLSWLCDGPPRYDPRDRCDFGRLNRLLLLAACTRFDVDPDSFAWLCERWPDDMAHAQPQWVAGVVRAACDRTDPRFDDVCGVERMVAALERVAANQGRDTTGALVAAADIWAFLFERVDRALAVSQDDNCEAEFATIQYLWSRCVDDRNQRVTERLGRARAMTLFCSDPRSYRPWRCTWAGARAWRRWCRVRPMPVHASLRESASVFYVWLVDRGLVADRQHDA